MAVGRVVLAVARHSIDSNFDIMGQGVANPIGALWTASMMLEHLGESTAASRLMRAIESYTANGELPRDLGGGATTAQVTQAICEAIRVTND